MFLCVELKDLRNAIQKDLERYPVSDTSSVKDVKSTHRSVSRCFSCNEVDI